MGKRKMYSEEFKREAVNLTRQPGANVSHITRDIGVAASQLFRWRREVGAARGGKVFTVAGVARDEELLALTRELAKMKKERVFSRCGSVLCQGIELKYQTILRCRDVYPIQLMCRCLKVSTSGFHAWSKRPMSPRDLDNQRLLAIIREHHRASDGVMGMPRMHELLEHEGETASPNRVARLMAGSDLYGIPQRRQWRRKRRGVRPTFVRNHLNRDFSANEPNTKWVIDITQIDTSERWRYLCVVTDLYRDKTVGWSTATVQDRHLVIRAVQMACWERTNNESVILHSDRGTQFTSYKYQDLLKSNHLISSMSAVGHCGDNAPAEGFLGMIKRERTNRRRYRTIEEAQADVFDYIERFHNPRIQRRIDALDRQFIVLTQPSA